MSQPMRTIVLMQSSGKYSIHRKMFSSECAISAALSYLIVGEARTKHSLGISMKGCGRALAWVAIDLSPGKR